MPSALFEQMGKNGNSINPMLAQIKNFAARIQGNPQEQVQNLLNSGKLNQNQFNALYQQAQQIVGMFGLK